MKHYLPLLFLLVLFPSGSAQATDNKIVPNPSSLVLDQSISLITVPGMPEPAYKVNGTVTLAVHDQKIDPAVVSKKPSIILTGLAESGALLAQTPAASYVEATSELTLPLSDGSAARYLMLQYPFTAYLTAKPEIKWICASSGRLKDCVKAPPLKGAKILLRDPPQSKIEITSCKIFTAKSKVATPSIALAGVAEVVITDTSQGFPMEIPVSITVENSLGQVLTKQGFRAKLFFLRHTLLPNPAYQPNAKIPVMPYLIVAIPLYQFSGNLPLTGDPWEIRASSENASFGVKPCFKNFQVIDSNRDGTVSDLDDINGDGAVDPRDWLGMTPPS